MVKRAKIKVGKAGKSRALATARKGQSKVSALEAKIAKMVVARPMSIGGKIGETFRRFGDGIAGMSKLWGYGDYKMSGNSCFDSVAQQIPFMHSEKSSIRLKHREYLGDVAGTTSAAPNVLAYGINPGLPMGMAGALPILSGIAANFQEYKWHGLAYEFKTTSATAVANSTNANLGSVSLVVQYRADAQAPFTKSQLLNEMWSADGPPYKDILLPVECKPNEVSTNVQYVRTAALPANQDRKLYDVGTLYVATTANPSTNSLGELWVTYDVELFKPVPSVINIPYPMGLHIKSTTGIANTTPFGNTIALYNTLGMTFNTSQLFFPPGWVGSAIIVYEQIGNAATYAPPTFTFAGGLSSVAIDGNTLLANYTGDSINTSFFVTVVTATGTTAAQTPSLTVSGGTIPTSSTAMSCMVFVINPGFF